ncbi:MAG: hypothetical protein ACFCUH_07865 [Flavobacteriales bacterium]
MKKILTLAACAALACLPVVADAQFQGISTEVYAVDGVSGYNTYRVYAEFGSPTDQLIAQFGIDSAPLSLSAAGGFYHDAVGNPLSTGINAALIPSFPSLEFDSWLTIGATNQTGNSLQSVGFNFATFEAGGQLLVNDAFGAVLFTLPGDAQNFPVGGRVLMAQLTASGNVTGTLNVQWRNGAGQSFDVEGINLSIVPGCTDPTATNYDPSASIDDGSCSFAQPSFTGLTWELVGNNTVPGFNTYRVYANFDNPGDELTAVYGINTNPLLITTSGTFYQNALTNAFSTGVSPVIITADPLAAFDSWVTIGAENSVGNNLQNIGVPTAAFESGSALSINDANGGAWFVFPGDQPTASPDAQGRVLIAQLTTDGIVDFTINLQYRATDGSNPQEVGLNLVFPDAILGCTDPTACNFSSAATQDDGSCLFLDACGNCGGTATAGCTNPAACNFDATAGCDNGSCLFLDACGNCGGTAIAGCTNPAACNFDATAGCDDGSCLFLDACGNCGGTATAGCTNPAACNFDAAAGCDDGSCLFLDACGNCGGTATAGCTNPAACNFDATAGCDNGSCLFLDACGNCGGTATAGCTDAAACNFDAAAGCDDGSCFFSDNCDNCPATTCTDVYESFDDGNFTAGVVWGGSTNSWNVNSDSDAGPGATCSLTARMNVTTSTSGRVYLSTAYSNWQDAQDWSFWLGRRGQALTSANTMAFWLYADQADLTSATINGYRIIIGDNSGGDEFFLQRVENGVATTLVTSAALNNGITDVGVAIRVQRSASGQWTLFTSSLALTSGGGVTAADCPSAEATVLQGTAIDNAVALTGTGYMGIDVVHSSGATARTAVEFDNLSISTELQVVPGCTDSVACNFDPLATEDDGSCEFAVPGFECGVIPGCTYAAASNFNPAATLDDGSCLFECSIPGCTNPLALNFNSAATVDDGSCVLPVPGCTDATATNFNPLANVNDGTCIATVFGCTDPAAFNFNPSANVDNGGCVDVRPGCTDPSFDNFNPFANQEDGSCANGTGSACVGDLNNDGVINSTDLSVFLSVFGTFCD